MLVGVIRVTGGPVPNSPDVVVEMSERVVG